MLKEIIDEYMQKVPVVKDYCKRCLETKRWGGSVVLMVLDAAFTSVGLNYFQIVVPGVERLRQEFVKTGKVNSLEDLIAIDANAKEVEEIWKNKRSWKIAKSIASYLVKIKQEKRHSTLICLLSSDRRSAGLGFMILFLWRWWRGRWFRTWLTRGWIVPFF